MSDFQNEKIRIIRFNPDFAQKISFEHAIPTIISSRLEQFSTLTADLMRLNEVFDKLLFLNDNDFVRLFGRSFMFLCPWSTRKFFDEWRFNINNGGDKSLNDVVVGRIYDEITNLLNKNGYNDKDVPDLYEYQDSSVKFEADEDAMIFYS